MCPTPKAVVKLFIRAYGKGGGFFLVNGTTDRIVPSSFNNIHPLLNNFNNINAANKVLNKMLRDSSHYHSVARLGQWGNEDFRLFEDALALATSHAKHYL